MKKEYLRVLDEWGAKAFQGMRDADAKVMATDCPLAAMQIEQATGVHPMHPIEVLRAAYEDNGFPEQGAAAGSTKGMTMKRISKDDILGLEHWERHAQCTAADLHS